MHYVAASIQEFQSLATQVLHQLPPNNTLALYGDLGSGKTTFTQALGKQLKITKRILSPTFVLMRQYAIPQHPLYNNMIHLDLYRLSSVTDIKSIDLDEYITDPKNLVVIEWAEKAQPLLPQNRLDIHFKVTPTGEHEITY